MRSTIMAYEPDNDIGRLSEATPDSSNADDYEPSKEMAILWMIMFATLWTNPRLYILVNLMMIAVVLVVGVALVLTI